MLADEGDMSNYIGVNRNKNSDGKFELSQLHMVEKLSTMLYSSFPRVSSQYRRLLEKPLMHKYESSIGRKCVWNYRSEVGMLSYLQGSIWP